MAEPVKPRRRYHSPRRQEQAAATRRAILEAAQRLFEQQGYAGDDDGGDRGRGRRRAEDRLPRLRDQERAAAGAVGPAPEGRRGRRGRRRAAVVPGGRSRSRTRSASCGSTRATPAWSSSASAGVLEVIRDAAPVDPDTAALWRLIQTDFYANQRVIVETLHGEAGAAAGPRRRPRDRHPLDAQPPRRVAAARRRARLDPRAVRAVVRRHRLRAAPPRRQLDGDADREGRDPGHGAEEQQAAEHQQRLAQGRRLELGAHAGEEQRRPRTGPRRARSCWRAGCSSRTVAATPRRPPGRAARPRRCGQPVLRHRERRRRRVRVRRSAWWPSRRRTPAGTPGGSARA